MDAHALREQLADLIERIDDSFGMPVLDVGPAGLLRLAQRLKDELQFALLLDITAVDHAARTPRFDLVYHFRSQARNARIRVKTALAEEPPQAPTLTTLYGSARFLEREVHDMYGIVFAGNDDLRPILLYEGFVGHPLRKDYDMEAEQPLVPYRR